MDLLIRPGTLVTRIHPEPNPDVFCPFFDFLSAKRILDHDISDEDIHKKYNKFSGESL